MQPTRRAALLLLVGLLLLGNSAYVYPENVAYETTYTYGAEETDGIPSDVSSSDAAVRECDWHPVRSQSCAVARYLARNPNLTLALRENETVSREFAAEYDFVETPDGYFEPNATVENGTLVLSLRPVGPETVRRAAAEPFSEAHPVARRAIRNGTATVPKSAVYEARTFYVERRGTYYAVRPVERGRTPVGWGWTEPPRWVVGLLRLAGWVGGVALVWRAGEWTERARRTDEEARAAETRDDRTR